MSLDPGADTRYLLSDEQSRQIFTDRIAPRHLAHGAPQDQPVVIVLSAQAGAGKTTLARELADRFEPTGGIVSVDVDMFKPFHPAYGQLTAEMGATAGDLVHADARRWFEQSLDHLAARRVNVIAEHGLRTIDVTNSLLARFDQAGYRIEGALLATPAAQSKLGILERYQVGYEKTGFGRILPEDLHDARYQQLLQVAGWLQDDRRVQAISIHPFAQPDPIYRNERNANGQWTTSQGAADALAEERTRGWDISQSRQFLLRHHSLSARLTPEWQDYLASARAEADPLLHPDTPHGPTRDRPAVTYGRYQLVSIAHLDTVRTIAHEWPSAVVGVLDLAQEPRPATADLAERYPDFYAQGTKNMAPARNPMTVNERIEIWKAALQAEGLADRVTVVAIPPPEFDPQAFNEQFPPDRYDLVFPAAAGAELPHQERSAILERPVHTVAPPLEYHTSDIRRSYQEGTDNWRQALAPGTLEPFVASDGPRRLLTVGEQKSPDSPEGDAARHLKDAAKQVKRPRESSQPTPPSAPAQPNEPEIER